MSESVSGSAAASCALTGASLYGLLTGTDYSVVFGAFAGAAFYVATAADLTLPRRTAYFVVSDFAGVYGPGWGPRKRRIETGEGEADAGPV